MARNSTAAASPSTRLSPAEAVAEVAVDSVDLAARVVMAEVAVDMAAARVVMEEEEAAAADTAVVKVDTAVAAAVVTVVNVGTAGAVALPKETGGARVLGICEFVTVGCFSNFV